MSLFDFSFSFLSLTSLIFVLSSLLSSWFIVCHAHRRSLLIVDLSALSHSISLLFVCNVADLSTLWPQCRQVVVAFDSPSHLPSLVQIYDYLSLTPWVPICRLWVLIRPHRWRFLFFFFFHPLGSDSPSSVEFSFPFLFLFLFFCCGWWW